MPLAHVNDSVTCGWTADVKFLQLPDLLQVGDENPVNVLFDGDVVVLWTQFGLDNYINVTIPGDPDPIEDQALVGSWTGEGSEEDPYVWTGPSEYTVSPSYSLGPLWPYKVRDDEPKPPAFSAPRHPLHKGMKYAWGSPDYDITYASGLGLTFVTEEQVMVPSWAASGGGTTDMPGGTLGITVGHAASLFAMDPVSGLVCHITNITMAGVAVDMEAVRLPSTGSVNGMHAEFSGDEIWLYCDDYQAASLNNSEFKVTIYPSVICDYRLRLWDWQAAMAGDFSIHDPDPDETGRIAVASVYEQRVYYGREVYATTGENIDHGRRIWDVDVTVDPTWASANDEVVDSDDTPCVLEESDLGMDPDSPFTGLQVARAQELSLQLPSDAGGSLPSVWVSQTGGLTVNQNGKTTEVTVGAAVVDGSIKRTLVTDYIDYRTTDKATYGIPGAYRLGLHKPFSDIWNIENYRFIAFDYTSAKAVTLVLTITHTLITDNDTHVEPNREADYGYDTSEPTVVHNFDVAVASARVYVDLAAAADPRLRYLVSCEISGFNGDGEWQFDIEDMAVVQYDPTAETEVGRGDLKATYARPAVSYEGFTQTGEGIRICRPGDQAVTACGEEGMVFCEQVTGPGGTADALRRLDTFYREWARQEGFVVASVSNPLAQSMAAYNCREGHATYDASFVDVDDNDMLDDTLYAADVQERIDTTTLNPLAVTPRVGHIYPLAGYPIPVYVDKILHGSIHGIMRSNNVPQGPALAVQLYEQDTGIVAITATDNWSRFRFSGEAGVRENFPAGVGFDAEPTAEYKVYNELRVWVTESKLLLWDPDTDSDAEGVVWRVAENNGVVYAHYLEPSSGAGWVAVATPFGSADEHWVPSIACLDDGALLACATFDGDMVFARSRDRGRTWEEMAGLGDDLEYGKIWARRGCVHACGWDSDKIWYAASTRDVDLAREALNEGGDLVLEVASAVVGVGEETPRSCVLQHDDGSIVVCVGFISGDMRTYRAKSADIGFVQVS